MRPAVGQRHAPAVAALTQLRRTEEHSGALSLQAPRPGSFWRDRQQGQPVRTIARMMLGKSACDRSPLLWGIKGENGIVFSVGSERASTVRQIRSGKICAICRRSLPPPHTLGEQLCGQCRTERKRHRVYMSYIHRDGWLCQFLEEDLKTLLPKRVSVKSEEQLREMAKRGGANMNLESLQAMDHGISIGRGGVWLELTEEQYQKLKAQ